MKYHLHLNRGETVKLTVLIVSFLTICTATFLSPQSFHTVSLSGTPARYTSNTEGHWQKGDSIYDADSQAKLISLTNAYYNTADNGERSLITAKANEIREAAGTAGEDSLIDKAKVSSLGQSLDVMAASGELSRATLLAIEKPYVGISAFVDMAASKTSLKTVTIFSFGKVDIEIARYTNFSVMGSPATIAYDLTLTAKAHYSAYFIYNVGWEDDCSDALNALESSGISESDIGTASITSNYKFIDSWNSINLTSGGLSTPYVIIDSHATPFEIDSGDFRIFSDSISRLQSKHINRLILLGCNAGQVDFQDSNPAAAFAKKIFGGFVLASDGTVYNIGANLNGSFQYESRNDAIFQHYAGPGRKSSLGWVVYQCSDDNIVTFNTFAYTLTMSKMLDYFKPLYHLELILRL